MSALGRHRDSILDLQSFHQANLAGVANYKISCEVVNRNGNNAIVGVFFFDDDNDRKSPAKDDSARKAMKSHDAMVSDDDDEMFGVIIDEEENFTEPSNDFEDDCMFNEFVSKTPLHRTQMPKKGILKQIIVNGTKSSSGSNKQRRHNITLSRKSSCPSTSSSTRKNARFSNDQDQVHEVMPLQLYRSDVWWDHDDYENFKKTAVFLAHAVPNDDTIRWINGSHESEPPAPEQSTPDFNSDVNDICEKWWCKFGHSRRGLEHLCCEREGTLRKTKVEELMKAVLNEQYKQAVKRRRGKGFDHSAITRVSMKHTQWAKDLALAAGYADANSVVTEFDEEIKKNREDYMHIVSTMSNNGKIMGKSLSSLALNKLKRFQAR